MKRKLYEQLYEWLVSETCDNCQHMQTFRDGDKRHPCNKCEGYDRFKVSENVKEDLNDKVYSLLEIIKN